MIRFPALPILLALLCAFSAAAQETVGADAATLEPFLLSPGDVIDVSVVEDPGLNRQVLIRPDGRISLPLAGTVMAAGRSPEAVAADIRRALARDFVEPPSVTVSLSRLAEQPPGEESAVEGGAEIFILGEVGRPGRLQVRTPIDILRVLALVGGPGTFAARDRIQIRRRTDGVDQVFLFDYTLIEDGRVPVNVIDIADGDVIVVPERGLFD